MADREAQEEEDDAPDSEEPASQKPKPEAKDPKKKEPELPAKVEPAKPVSKSVEWGIALAMMVVLVGFLLLMIHFMRSARSAVM